jgi:GTP-binding protein EngB required for normal cell division
MPKNENELDIEDILKKIDTGYEHTKIAENRDLVLVIGNTGVGKSTTCNYVLGHKMKRKEHNFRSVIVTDDRPTVPIGLTATPETLYATPILHPAFPWLLTDCPGFFGDRSVEDRIVESISTELVIRKANRIKGVLILISIDHLKEAKATELRGLVKTLTSLFKDPIEMVQYSTFIITKKEDYMPEDRAIKETIGGILALQDHCKTQIVQLSKNPMAKSAEGLTPDEYNIMSSYFSAILEKNKTDPFIFINPLDGGASKNQIIERINNTKTRRGISGKLTDKLSNTVEYQTNKNPMAITIEDFNFSNYDQIRIKFNKVIYKRAADGSQLISNIRNCAKLIFDERVTIQDAEKRLNTLNELLSSLENNNNKTELESNNGSISKWEKLIDQNNETIKSKESRCKEIKNKNDMSGEYSDKESELRTIDKDTPSKFVEKSINERVPWYNLFGWKQMDFEADTCDRNVPIVQVDNSMESGKWYNVDDRRQTGTYKCTNLDPK